jgi:hypothetical protein
LALIRHNPRKEIEIYRKEVALSLKQTRQSSPTSDPALQTLHFRPCTADPKQPALCTPPKQHEQALIPAQALLTRPAHRAKRWQNKALTLSFVLKKSVQKPGRARKTQDQGKIMRKTAINMGFPLGKRPFLL